MMKNFRPWQMAGRPADALAETVLETERLSMRPARVQDWSQWEAVRRRNYPALKPLEPAWPADALSQAFFNRRVNALCDDWRQGRSRSFLIWRKNGPLIGGFNLNQVCRGAAQQATLGYWLDVEAQGQGLMTEAARRVAAYGFGLFGLHRLQAATLTDNARSQALLVRLGFTGEGFAERYIQIDGAWRDHKLYGLTIEAWRSGRGNPLPGPAVNSLSEQPET